MGIGLTLDEYEEEHREKDERIAELERELAEARRVLRRYGEHDIECAARMTDQYEEEPCDCGFDAARKGEQ